MSRNSTVSSTGIPFPPMRLMMRDLSRGLVVTIALALTTATLAQQTTSLGFEVSLAPELPPQGAGRLFVILARTNSPEPRLALGRTGLNAPCVLALDLARFVPGATASVDRRAFIFPLARLALLEPGTYVVQALFDSSRDLRSAGAPGNVYSTPQQLYLDAAKADIFRLQLNSRVPEEQLPPDTPEMKFFKLSSRLLSDFHHRPIFLRAALLLPRSYAQAPERRYPLWVRIGGLNTRYATISTFLRRNSEFRRTWGDSQTPEFLLLQLDGAGPFGDPYYINSANSGPYGDALVQELIPYVEAHVRALGLPRGRVLSGTSTGGWVSLALQIFYPDFFNGAWSSCPDPVDFRALELVNIYSDTNAYVNRFGYERPSERTLLGDVRLTMRREVGVENLLGRGNFYPLSGEQWGAWTALFSPRGADGRPVPLWDPETGRIDRAVSEQWKKYDLRIYLEQHWRELAPKLRRKIHIAAGEADQYFLNNAVHLLDDSLRKVSPPFEGTIVYGPGKGHGWSNLSVAEMLREMNQAVESSTAQ